MAATLVEVSAHQAGAMLESTGGNPFYVEQLCAAMAESDPGAELPHSLQSLIGARIDALAEAERGTLDLAAIMGREFRPGHVAALAGSGPDPVRAGLTRLCHRRLVEPPAAPGADVFRFSNGLIHEATYRVMAKRVRADRHERAAEVLAEDRAPIATVAGHLEHAYRYRTALGVPHSATAALRSRTAALLAAAGAQALTRCDLVWADDLLGRAVELFSPGEPGRATALLRTSWRRVISLLAGARTIHAWSRTRSRRSVPGYASPQPAPPCWFWQPTRRSTCISFRLQLPIWIVHWSPNRPTPVRS